MSPACPVISLLSRPYPPAPLPLRGRGRFKVYFAGGFAPGTPAIGWEAALDLLLENGTFSLSGKKFSTEGKDSNAARDADTIGDYPCRTPTPQVQQVPHGFRLRGCKGRSPLHKITLSPPLPAGKGVGGMGAETKLKAGQRQDPPTPKNKSSNIHRRVMCRTPQSGMIRSRNHRAWMRLRKQKKQKETERLDRNSESQQMPRGTAGPPGRHTPHTERHRSRQLLRTHRICRSRQNNPAGNDGRMHKTGRGHRADQRI